MSDLTVILDGDPSVKEVLEAVYAAAGFVKGNDYDEETAGRMFKALKEYAPRFHEPPAIKVFEAGAAKGQLITWDGGKVNSLCRHHFMPFFGKVNISYIPNDKIIGISKLPRIVNYLCKRPTLQEYLTYSIVEKLKEVLNPAYIEVKMRCAHSCMVCRGPQADGWVTTTAKWVPA